MSTTFTLVYPFQFGEKREITELELRRPTAKDMRALPLQIGLGDILTMASKLAGEPPALIDKIDGEDVMRLAEVIGGFLGSSQATGESA